MQIYYSVTIEGRSDKILTMCEQRPKLERSVDIEFERMKSKIDSLVREFNQKRKEAKDAENDLRKLTQTTLI